MKQHLNRRFPCSLLLGLLGIALASCSGGGGSSSSTQPLLLAAAYDGLTLTPTEDDHLVLSFTEEMTNITGTEIDDAQLTLSNNATLGAGAIVTSQPTPQSLRIKLGLGVDFVPDVTAIALATTNSVFRDAAGTLAAPGTPMIIENGDGSIPTVSNLTVAAVEDSLNGTGAAGGTLQAPKSGWTIDLAWSDAGLGIDTSRTFLSANVPVSTTSGSLAPGTNLIPYLTPVTVTSSAASYLVPSTTQFPESPVTLSAIAIDNSGLASVPATYPFTVRAFNDEFQPFETSTNSSQVWFIDTHRDIESFTALSIPGGAEIPVIPGSNGQADYIDLLFVIGLQSAAPITTGSSNTNVIIQERLQAEMLSNLNALFDGSNITFTFTQPAGSFGTNSTRPYSSFGYSQICLAGSADTPGVLGVAQLDPSNALQNNNCKLESLNGNRLGVFLHTIANNELGPPSSSAFRQVFDNFTPINGGLPIGESPQDDDRLLNTLNDTRATQIDSAIADLARFASIVLAHECSHSMGLVINGPMPIGLYGNDSVNFPGSTDGHIQNFNLPFAGTNVMSPALSYQNAINPDTVFNTLNLAYLREQVFYGN